MSHLVLNHQGKVPPDDQGIIKQFSLSAFAYEYLPSKV